MKMFMNVLFFMVISTFSTFATAQEQVSDAEFVNTHDLIIADGLRYYLDRSPPHDVKLRVGEEKKIGLTCFYANMGLFTRNVNCIWESTVVGANERLLELPGGISTDESTPNLGRYLVLCLILLALAIMLPSENALICSVFLILVAGICTMLLLLSFGPSELLFWLYLLLFLSSLAAFFCLGEEVSRQREKRSRLGWALVPSPFVVSLILFYFM